MSGLMSVRSALVSVQAADADTPYWTAERVWSSAAAGVGLIGVIFAVLALTGRIGDRAGKAAFAAQVAGLVAIVVGAVDLALADGGPGTGNGVVGAGLALVLGVAAVVVGRRARRRPRVDRAARHQPSR
ncbi:MULTISPECIES: DUF6223 family protein [unclassified Streptomyces]|uniref:DUF6223 family protein n=1 Tax=unclassified Streptomyces TaxID=2593676 RepID=UPI00278BE379|nr:MULTISPECIES: DUF6223 family protein [unclassified Streptomyces]